MADELAGEGTGNETASPAGTTEQQTTAAPAAEAPAAPAGDAGTAQPEAGEEKHDYGLYGENKEDESGEEGGDQPAETAAGEDEFALDPIDGVTHDEELLTSFRDIAKEAGLNKEQANRLNQIHAQSLLKSQVSYHDQMMKAQAEIHKKWMDEIRNDPEFGGANLESSQNYARQAIGRFLPDSTDRKQFMDTLEQCGMTAQPQLFRLLANIGRVTGEASPVRGEESAPPREKTTAELLFGSGETK